MTFDLKGEDRLVERRVKYKYVFAERKTIVSSLSLLVSCLENWRASWSESRAKWEWSVANNIIPVSSSKRGICSFFPSSRLLVIFVFTPRSSRKRSFFSNQRRNLQNRETRKQWKWQHEIKFPGESDVRDTRNRTYKWKKMQYTSKMKAFLQAKMHCILLGDQQ
jgi:hypothetical protein